MTIFYNPKYYILLNFTLLRIASPQLGRQSLIRRRVDWQEPFLDVAERRNRDVEVACWSSQQFVHEATRTKGRKQRKEPRLTHVIVDVAEGEGHQIGTMRVFPG